MDSINSVAHVKHPSASTPLPQPPKRPKSAANSVEFPSHDEIRHAPMELLLKWCKQFGMGVAGVDRASSVRTMLKKHFVDHPDIVTSTLPQAKPPKRPPPPPVSESEDLRGEVSPSHQPPGLSLDANGIESCYEALKKFRSLVVSLSEAEDVRSLSKLSACVAETFATCTEAMLKLLQPLLSLNRPSLSSSDRGTTKPSYSQVVRGPTNETSFTDIPTRPSRQAPTNYRKINQDAKKSALSKLAAENPIRDDRSGQLIVEPEMEGFRKVEISKLLFMKELNSFLEHSISLVRGCEKVWRLPRGGFRVQFSEESLSKLQAINDRKLVLASKGTWIIQPRDPSLNSRGPAIAVQGIDLSLSTDAVLDELINHNHSSISWDPSQIAQSIQGCERCKRRDQETKSLVPTRTMKLIVTSEIAEILLLRRGFYVASCPVFVRKWEPPRYRCFACNQVGFHKASQCRAQIQRASYPRPNVSAPMSSSINLASGVNWGDVEDEDIISVHHMEQDPDEDRLSNSQ